MSTPGLLTSEHFYAILTPKNPKKSLIFHAQNLKSIGFHWFSLSELTWRSRHPYAGNRPHHRGSFFGWLVHSGAYISPDP